MTPAPGRSSPGADHERSAATRADRPALFAGVDRALVMAALAERLRQAGVAVPLGATERATAALGLVAATSGGLDLDDLYWLTRLSLVADRSKLDRFDAVFAAVFRTHDPRTERRRDGANDHNGAAGQQHHHRLRTVSDGPTVDGGGLPWTTRPTAVADLAAADPADPGIVLADLLPVAAPGDPGKPFDLLDEVELERAGRLLEASIERWPTRHSRRQRPSSTGSTPQLRAALRRALRTGGEPLLLPTSRARIRRRPVTMLIDVSGSMESFARAYLHVARALAAGGRAEVFAFATEVTRLTPALRLRSPVEAIDRATSDVGDRFGGTRLATSLATLLRHRSWSSAARGAVVVIVSDGWDTDPPELLTRHLARLRRMARRIVWVNPRLAADDYEPKVAAMAAALPYCDHFLPGHSLSAMADVLTAITAD